jgi:uncharacterized membrane protein
MRFVYTAYLEVFGPRHLVARRALSIQRTALQEAQMKVALLWMLALGCVANVACGDDSDGEDEEGGGDLGPATGAACDPSLTYQKDIAPLMTAYCTRCHATTLTGAARMNAPEDHNFDSEQGILAEKSHVDKTAGSGPNATNTIMPLTDPKPTKAERETLAKWIACQP